MAEKMFTIDFSGVQDRILAAQTMIQSQQYNPWGKFMKWNTPDKKAVTPNGSIEAAPVPNSPIVVHRELVKSTDGGVAIQVPMLRELTGRPQRGNEQLSGTGEIPEINFARVVVDEVRKAVITRRGNMGNLAMKGYKIPDWARGAMQRHYARWCGFAEIPSAFYKGFSDTVLNSGIYTNDTNVAVRPHPHIYVAGAGKVAYTGGYPGTAGYATAVAVAINSLGNSGLLTGSLFKALNVDDDFRKIPYLYTKDNVPYRIWAVGPYGMAQLRNDPDIKALNNALFVQNMAKENPNLTGMQLFYEGHAFFDFGNAIWPVASNGTTTTWGPTTIADLNSFGDYSSYTKFGAICLGDQSLMQAIGWDMQFTGEVRDHGHIEELGYSVGTGFARPDFWNNDDGSTGQYVNNTTSCVLVHYADKPTLA